MGAFVMRLSVNEASKSRMIEPRNWLNPVDEKKHRDEILDNMKKFLDNYFDSFEILVELDKLADGADQDTQKLEELQAKFQEKEKEIRHYLRLIERSTEALRYYRYEIAYEIIANFRILGLEPSVKEKADW